ncbi:MAG: UvrD-helicase domain-containing protein [Candidatus Dormiibacterota bacterium]
MLSAAETLLRALNPAQREAVEAPDGPLLIFAGAGSGKTRALTHRIAYVIASRGVRPHEILAVTFTNKAAREMRARVEALLGGAVTGMWLGTFHAVGARILRRDGDAIGIPSNFTIYDEADRLAAMRRALAAAGMDDKRFSPSRVVHTVSNAKNELLDAAAFAGRAEGHWEQEVARAYRAYEAELARAAALDFDDLLMRPVQLLQDVPPVLEHYQNRWRHIFVDEYQDTNHAQYVMVSLLAATHRNLTVVGDDDQAVYRFRGADIRNILEFRKDFPDARVVTLEQNYRSTQPILDVAHAVIRLNEERAAKRLWTERSGGDTVRLIPVYDEQEEALTVTAEIERLIGTEGLSLSDFAVLYRTNAQSRAFEEAFIRRGIAYRLVGGIRFYERKEVKDVLAYLRLVVNPRDPVAFSRVANVPRRRIGEKSVAELERIARRRGISPFEAVQHLDEEAQLGAPAIQALSAFAGLLARLGEMSTRLPVPRLLERIVDDTGYRQMVKDGSKEGDERWENVTELIGYSEEYADVPPPDGVHQFLENVALVSDVDSLDESTSGVTLITLHQVKGLEFPVVFLAGMEEGLLPHVRAIEEGDEGIAEERRLAYVGVTRAQHRLYLLHAFRRHLYGTAQLAQASRFLGDIPMDTLEVARRPGGPPVVVPRAPGAARQALHAYAVRANPVEVAPQRFTEGMRVEHPVHGAGTILKSTMTRSGEEVVIRFDEAGVKIFAVADAKLFPAGS